MQVDGPTATVFGVKINFPRLTQRIGLDEVTLVVHVKPVSHRVIFEVSNETCDVYGGHQHSG